MLPSLNTKSNLRKKMAKFFKAAALVAVVLCFSSFLSSAYANDLLFVEGMVYCDVCRVEFETRISTPLEGATVQLNCRSRANETLTFSLEGITDKDGKYSLAVEGDHEEDICEVKLVKSPRSDCSEAFKVSNVARVLVSKNVGVVDRVRHANALGFMQDVAQPDCPKVLQEMGFAM